MPHNSPRMPPALGMPSQVIVLILLAMLSFLALPSFLAMPSFSLEIQWNFDQGSLGAWRQIEDNAIDLSLANSANGHWFYFRVDQAKNQTISFRLSNMRGDLFGDDYSPCISYDQINWSWIKSRSAIPGASGDVSIIFNHTFIQDRAWIAFSPPYSNPMLDAFLASFKDHPHLAVEALFQTPAANLPVLQATLSDPDVPENQKQTVFIMGRQSGCESAASYLCQGAMQFLLSDDPIAAALKRRITFIIIPCLDRDSVAAGFAQRPLNDGHFLSWSNEWDEKRFSFFEQREMKQAAQSAIVQNATLSLSLMIHANEWRNGSIQRGRSNDSLLENQKRLFIDVLEKKYLPWHVNQETAALEPTFSNWLFTLFPQAITGSVNTDWVYGQPLAGDLLFFKTPDDLLDEGELLAYALADYFGVPASDPPPFLHGAECYQLAQSQKKTAHVRCIYHDILNRPPESIQVFLNEKAYDLAPIPETANPNGTVYSAFIPLEAAVNQHYFLVSNGAKTRRYPREGFLPGPYLAFNSPQQ